MCGLRHRHHPEFLQNLSKSYSIGWFTHRTILQLLEGWLRVWSNRRDAIFHICSILHFLTIHQTLVFQQVSQLLYRFHFGCFQVLHDIEGGQNCDLDDQTFPLVVDHISFVRKWLDLHWHARNDLKPAERMDPYFDKKRPPGEWILEHLLYQYLLHHHYFFFGWIRRRDSERKKRVLVCVGDWNGRHLLLWLHDWFAPTNSKDDCGWLQRLTARAARQHRLLAYDDAESNSRSPRETKNGWLWRMQLSERVLLPAVSVQHLDHYWVRAIHAA